MTPTKKSSKMSLVPSRRDDQGLETLLLDELLLVTANGWRKKGLQIGPFMGLPSKEQISENSFYSI